MLLIAGGAYAIYEVIFQTPHGRVIVEIEGDDIEARFKNGKIELYDKDGKLKYTLQPTERTKEIPSGKYDVKVASVEALHLKVTGADGLELETDKFEMKRGGQIIVRVVLEPIVGAKQDVPVVPGPLPTKFSNSLGMEFSLVPKGKSWLGGGGGKFGDQDVEITQDFYLGKYEVTQEEWEKVMGTNPSHFSRTGGRKDEVKDVPDDELKRFPVEMVSWEDCQVFVTRLNEKVKENGWVYRLPNEMEWEYACRGGPMADRFDSAFDFYFEKPQNQLLPEQANFKQSEAWKRPRMVGRYNPNRLGLYDMHGNVREWCEDAEKATRRVVRGGMFDYPPGLCRAACRDPSQPSAQGAGLGLRLARVRVGEEGWISLTDGGLAEWRQDGNDWVVVGDKQLDPNDERRLTVQPGSGILFSAANGKGDKNLVSRRQFGDVELHAEFMIPNKGNSGVFFLSHYELQIWDSWGGKTLSTPAAAYSPFGSMERRLPVTAGPRARTPVGRQESGRSSTLFFARHASIPPARC